MTHKSVEILEPQEPSPEEGSNSQRQGLEDGHSETRPQETPGSKDIRTRKLQTIVDAAHERKALDPVVLDVSGLTSYTESLVVMGGNSTRQVRAIASHISKALKAKHEHPLGMEGGDDASWILIDANDTIVHIFGPDTREQFDIEGLWSDAPRIEIAPAKGLAGSAATESLDGAAPTE